MSDNDGKKPLGLGGSRPSNVKQSFSHGRTKNVVVETKRKRVVVPKPGAAKPATGGPAMPVGGDPSKRPAGISDVELARRMMALAMSKARETEEAAKREAEEAERAQLVHGGEVVVLRAGEEPLGKGRSRHIVSLI